MNNVCNMYEMSVYLKRSLILSPIIFFIFLNRLPDGEMAAAEILTHTEEPTLFCWDPLLCSCCWVPQCHVPL